MGLKSVRRGCRDSDTGIINLLGEVIYKVERAQRQSGMLWGIGGDLMASMKHRTMFKDKLKKNIQEFSLPPRELLKKESPGRV